MTVRGWWVKVVGEWHKIQWGGGGGEEGEEEEEEEEEEKTSETDVHTDHIPSQCTEAHLFTTHGEKYQSTKIPSRLKVLCK